MIKTVVRVIASAVTLFLCAALITALFFTAVLHESYTLCPLTESEVLGE